MTEHLRDYDVLAGVFTNWWRGLQGLSKSGNPILIGGSPKPPNRKALAELRRINIAVEGGQDAVDVTRALSIDAFRELVQHLRASDLAPDSTVRTWLRADGMCLEPVAIAAAAVARIRRDTGGKSDWTGATAKMLGAGFPDDQVFAEARFKRLMRCRNDWPGLMGQARRIAAILEREAPVGDLGASLVLWNHDPRISRDWAFQYFQKSFEEPEAPLPAASPTHPTA
ncbi:MAG: type I-E CRISPR-associated protein Cse2/CasB [Hyphomicrobium sp.]